MTIEVTAALLQSAVKGLAGARAPQWVGPINETIRTFQIGTPMRLADFLAQTGHESLGFALVRELWGPSQVSAQVTYERDLTQPWGPGLRRGDRNFKAYNLGNMAQGDGFRFRGRGLIQTTGRGNYAKARDGLRAILGANMVPDFEADPAAMEQPRWAAMTGGLFWANNGLNGYADAQDFGGQTERVNGGRNGWDDRVARRVQARRALGLS